jgi:hypothetical protein
MLVAMFVAVVALDFQKYNFRCPVLNKNCRCCRFCRPVLNQTTPAPSCIRFGLTVVAVAHPSEFSLSFTIFSVLGGMPGRIFFHAGCSFATFERSVQFHAFCPRTMMTVITLRHLVGPREAKVGSCTTTPKASTPCGVTTIILAVDIVTIHIDFGASTHLHSQNNTDKTAKV